MMAEAVAGPLLRAAADEAAEQAGLVEPSRRHDKRLEGLPPPMIPGNEESPTTLCAMQASGDAACLWAHLHECGDHCLPQCIQRE